MLFGRQFVEDFEDILKHILDPDEVLQLSDFFVLAGARNLTFIILSGARNFIVICLTFTSEVSFPFCNLAYGCVAECFTYFLDLKKKNNNRNKVTQVSGQNGCPIENPLNPLDTIDK